MATSACAQGVRNLRIIQERNREGRRDYSPRYHKDDAAQEVEFARMTKAFSFFKGRNVTFSCDGDA